MLLVFLVESLNLLNWVRWPGDQLVVFLGRLRWTFWSCGFWYLDVSLNGGFFSSGIIHFNRVFHINHPFHPFWGTSILYTPQLPGGFKYLIFSPRKLGKISNFTHTFQMGWNHQLVLYTPPRLTAWTWSHDGLVQMILRNPFGGPYSQVPAVNLLGCIFNSVQTKIPSQTAWTHTRAKMMGYQLDDSILLHKKIGVKHQTSSWYCWWFRKPKQPPTTHGMFLKPCK